MQMMKRSRFLLAVGSLALIATGCATGGGTGGESPEGLEPGSALEADASGAPSSDTSAFGDESGNPDSDLASDSSGESIPDATDAALTDAPMGPPQDIPTAAIESSSQDSALQQTSFDDEPQPAAAPVEETGSMLASAEKSPAPQATPAPVSKPAKKHVAKKAKKSKKHSKKQAAAKSKAQSKKHSKKSAASVKKGTNYVDAIQLNVRSTPSYDSPIVRRYLGGARVKVTSTSGGFAQLEGGGWVSTKYLSRKPTRKVSQNEVSRAWKDSKYKDTWQGAPNS